MTTPLHIASFNCNSGISRYAANFHKEVLEVRGFNACSPDQIIDINSVHPNTRIHLEIGINEKSTIALLYQLIKHEFTQLSVTLHDPPFLSWPYFDIRQPWLVNFAKFSQLYLRNFGVGEKNMGRIGKVYVLSQLGLQRTAERYSKAHLYYLPFLAPSILKAVEIQSFKPHLIFFGHIAKNKGIEYTLQVHKALLKKHPECQLYVVGRAIDSEAETYFKALRSHFVANVNYMGFVQQADLDLIFAKASVAVMPFEPYLSIVPASASIMDAMCRGLVVCATPVNAVTEFIKDGQTGLCLTRDLTMDVGRISSLLTNPQYVRAIAFKAIQHLIDHHSATQVGKAFDCVAPNREGIS